MIMVCQNLEVCILVFIRLGFLYRNPLIAMTYLIFQFWRKIWLHVLLQLYLKSYQSYVETFFVIAGHYFLGSLKSSILMTPISLLVSVSRFLDPRTDYGHPERAFFSNFWAWAEILRLKCFEAFVVFSAGLSAPILVLWIPCPCFLLFNH